MSSAFVSGSYHQSISENNNNNNVDMDESDDDSSGDAFRCSEESVSVGVSYTKQFTLSKSTQVKKLRTEWRSNVYLAKSRIQVAF